jgi:Holliday junction resolvasome RuvABC endonuclease subunit
MNVLGLDISMRATGVAIADDNYSPLFSGVVGESNDRGVDPEVDCIMRAQTQGDFVIPLIESFSPEVIVIEGPAYNPLVKIPTKNGFTTVLPKRVCQLWQLTGALKMAVFQVYSGPVVIVPPTTLKKHITGDGKADKTDMVKAIWDRFDIHFKDHNEADAFGLCVVYLDGLKKGRGKK